MPLTVFVIKGDNRNCELGSDKERGNLASCGLFNRATLLTGFWQTVLGVPWIPAVEGV